MADGGSSTDTTHESPVDSEVIHCVKLQVKQKNCDVTVTATELSWVFEDKKKLGTISVRRRDLVAIKTKATVKDKDTTVLTVVYVKQQKDFVLKRCEESFTGGNDVCTSVAKTLQDGINQCQDRPKRLLVLINPISGFSRGVKNYEKICAPIFEEAGIQTEVIVTVRAHHTEEILATFDLSSIDGIAVVGGDGLYHEAANGIVRRMAAEMGSDINDPNFTPTEFPVTIAIIPCGTGNGVAREQMGNFDTATAVYAAVLGFRSKKNLSSVFSNGKLLSYSILLVGYGLWGDVVYASETRRHWGVLRYPASIMLMMFMRFRTRSLNIEFKAPPEFAERNAATLANIKESIDSENKSEGKKNVDNIEIDKNMCEAESSKIDKSENPSEGDENVAVSPGNVENLSASEATKNDKSENKPEEKANDGCNSVQDKKGSNAESNKKRVQTSDERIVKEQSPGFTAVKGRYTGVVMLAEMISLSCNPSKNQEKDRVTNTVHLILSKPGGKFQYLKLLYKMFSRDPELESTLPDCFTVLNANEMKIRLTDPHDEASHQGRKELILNIDGDIQILERPEVHVKMFPERIPMFCNIPAFTGRH